MTIVKNFVTRFVNEEDGATMPEYGLMLALIAIVCIVAVGAIGTNAELVFQESADKLGGAVGGP